MTAISSITLLAGYPATQKSGPASVIGWSLVLIVLVLMAFVVVMRVKNWLTEDNEEIAKGPGFTLSDLRELHRTGKMSDEEFELAKSKILTGAKAMTEKMPDPLARAGVSQQVERSRPPREQRIQPLPKPPPQPQKPADISPIPLEPPPGTENDGSQIR